ncbi:hypothetical protein RvY_11677 [Ramazzottius varieornatus]|uniref:Uncharacterized protein n=1 Tax=Ramazzottius varieornatus TaxID=947166 RepID=A0A1D1VQQ3_RAMVA|nr:hypothetical protein RvY_11677 [Ramazzottius varieornatus]
MSASKFHSKFPTADRCVKDLKDLLRDDCQSSVVKFQLNLLDMLAVPLESLLAKCESNSLPSAPFVLQAVTKMQEFFSQAKVEAQDAKYMPESELFRDEPTMFDCARAEFRTALMKASKRLSNLTSTDPMLRHPGASFFEAVQIFSPMAFRNKLPGLSNTDIER